MARVFETRVCVRACAYVYVYMYTRAGGASSSLVYHRDLRRSLKEREEGGSCTERGELRECHLPHIRLVT